MSFDVKQFFQELEGVYTVSDLKDRVSKARSRLGKDLSPEITVRDLMDIAWTRGWIVESNDKLAVSVEDDKEDYFLASYLWLAEVELDSEGQVFEREPWMTVEVTDDPAYSNVNLAGVGL